MSASSRNTSDISLVWETAEKFRLFFFFLPQSHLVMSSKSNLLAKESADFEIVLLL